MGAHVVDDRHDSCLGSRIVGSVIAHEERPRNLYRIVRVVTSKITDARAPVDDGPARFPAYAVPADATLTLPGGTRPVLLVRRGEAPFEGRWAITGGFKRPAVTLDEAEKRELAEETGGDAASVVTRCGASGNLEREGRPYASRGSHR